ncbi:hypothetical protein [Nocardia sp. NPDC057668]
MAEAAESGRESLGYTMFGKVVDGIAAVDAFEGVRAPVPRAGTRMCRPKV